MPADQDRLLDDQRAARRELKDIASLFSFLAIGGFGALGYITVSAMLLALLPGLPGWVIGAGCYAALIVPIYLLHRRFSFRSHVRHSRALPRYVLVQGLALCLAGMFGHVLHGVADMPGLAASTLVIGLTSGVNYLILRGWAFASRRREAAS